MTEIEKVKLISKTFEAVKFDGTFESAVSITNFIKEKSEFTKILKFRIDHSFSGTELSFVAARAKNDPNSKNQEYSLRIGDYLVLTNDRFDKISADFRFMYFDADEQPTKRRDD